MIADWVKETISVGGSGNLTLSGAVDTEHITFNSGIGVGPSFVYFAQDGNDLEKGIGHLSASTTLVRDVVLETIVSGTLNRTSPTALTLSASTTISIVASTYNLLTSVNNTPYPSPMPGFPSFLNQGFASGTQVLNTTRREFYPYFRASSGFVTSASIYVTAAVASCVAKLSIYDVATNGKPGRHLKDMTDAATLDFSTTGIKTATPTTKIYLSSGLFYLALQPSIGTPTVRGYHSLLLPNINLGSSSVGTSISSLNTLDAFAPFNADESATTFIEGNSSISIMLG